MSVLELHQIRKAFGKTIALDGVDLRLDRGEVHALIGENGAGKSTLMNVVSGAIHPDDGRMALNGRPFAPTSTLDSRKNGIALIHQELSLIPHLTVAENILIGSEPARFGWVDRKELDRKANAVLNSFGHADLHPKAIVGDLSTAGQQVVEICRAIAAGADVVLMDEPTSSLQRKDVKHLFKLITKLRGEGVAIVYISHFLEEIREIADKFTVLRDGNSVVSGKISDVTDEFLVSQMVGRSVDHLFPSRRRATAAAPVALRVKEFSAPPELLNAEFELAHGEILGIAGLVGAGRSKLIRTIFGLDKAQSGIIEFGEQAMSARGGKPLIRLLQGMGYLSEDRKREGLTLNLSIADNITLTRLSSCSQLGWLDLSQQANQADLMVNKFGVRVRIASQPVQTLSGGNQQKVAFARLVHQKADILLLDEPTRGIDIVSRERIYQAIAELADEGKAILMVSSYLPELFGMCDRLAVMSRGRLSPARPISEWTPETVLQSAIGGRNNYGEVSGH